MVHRHAIWRLVLFVTLALLACTGDVLPGAGLQLIIATDLTAPTDFDTVRLEISQQSDDGSWGPALIAADFRVPEEVTLPTTFAIAAGRRPVQNALIRVSARRGAVPIVLREVLIQVPTNRLAALKMVLAASCVAQVKTVGGVVQPTCNAGESCNPETGQCGPSFIDVASLPDYRPGEESSLILQASDSGGSDTGGSDAAAFDGARDGSVAPPDGGPVLPDGAPTDASACERAALPGDLVVTEIMFQAPVDSVWIELRNVSPCRIDVAGIGVASRRGLSVGYDEQEMIAVKKTLLERGERVVFSSHPMFPVVPHLVHEATSSNAWLFTPYEIEVRRGTTSLQKIAMPDNTTVTVRYARALPETPCASVDSSDASTWPLAQTAVTPNTVDPGQAGTPGAANDTSCP